MNTNYAPGNSEEYPYAQGQPHRQDRRRQVPQGQLPQNYGQTQGEMPEEPYMSFVPPLPSVTPFPSPSGAAMPDMGSELLSDPAQIPGFLRSQIGKLMKVEFMSEGNKSEKTGRLVEVGSSFILLQSVDTYSTILCDLFSIRFVTIVDVPLGGCVVATP